MRLETSGDTNPCRMTGVTLHTVVLHRVVSPENLRARKDAEEVLATTASSGAPSRE